MYENLKIILTSLQKDEYPLMTPLYTATSFKCKKNFRIVSFWKLENQLQFFIDSSRELRSQLNWISDNHFQNVEIPEFSVLWRRMSKKQPFEVVEMLQNCEVKPIEHNFTSDLENSDYCSIQDELFPAIY